MSSKPGRNDPCPCNSGKKYKRCCLRKDKAAIRTKRRSERERIWSLRRPLPALQGWLTLVPSIQFSHEPVRKEPKPEFSEAHRV